MPIPIIIIIVTLVLSISLYLWTKSIYFTSVIICALSGATLASLFVWMLLGFSDFVFADYWVLLPIMVVYGISAIMWMIDYHDTIKKQNDKQ